MVELGTPKCGVILSFFGLILLGEGVQICQDICNLLPIFYLEYAYWVFP